MTNGMELYLSKIKKYGLTNDLEQLLYVGEIGCTLEYAIEILTKKIKGLIHE